MGDRRPGPLCASQLEPGWIDDGTMCRSRSSPPGPLGVAASFLTKLVMGATPRADRLPGEKEMFDDDITFIAHSPFAGTADGHEILKLLRRLQASGNIVYGDTAGDRGQWDGERIIVNKDFYGNSCKTIAELVHEASHAIWRGRHPIGKGKTESTEEGGKNEYYSVKNQLAIYKDLKKIKHCLADPVLESRLRQEEEGKLESAIAEHERQNREAP